MQNYTLYRDGDETNYFPAEDDSEAFESARRIWANDPGLYEIIIKDEYVGGFIVFGL